MSSEVPEADGIKLLRDGEPWTRPGHSKSGDTPHHPIRKRAWHRALKRGELWAFVSYEHMQSGGVCLNIGPNRFARVITDRYCAAGMLYITWPIEEK